MPNHNREPHPAGRLLRSIWPWVAVGLLALALLADQPGAWARPDQSPDYQTVPTLTPTPTSPARTPTPTPPSGRTPTPTAAAPTNTPQQPTATPGSPTATPAPGQPGATPSPTTTATPPAEPPAPVPPDQCWTFPTPGFSSLRLADLVFEAESDDTLVTPGQTVSLRLVVTNQGDAALRSLLLCSPLEANLRPGQPVASQGRARLEPAGLIAELGDLAPGQTARVEIELDIPADYPLGGVIESQAWLFSGGQRASTDLLTWALPPAWLPPTGGR